MKLTLARKLIIAGVLLMSGVAITARVKYFDSPWPCPQCPPDPTGNLTLAR